MTGELGSVFGMTVRAATDAQEWADLLERARAQGAIDVGEATRNDYAMVIDEKAGLIVVKDEETMNKLKAAIPARTRGRIWGDTQ